MTKAVIVIPTYNEAASIGKMLDYLNEKTFPQIKAKADGLSWNWDMVVLVVDDNSPDGTGKIVLAKAKKFPTVHLLARAAKTGIGTAYLDGFKFAIKHLQADYVFEMDGDFQHPPQTIPLALKALEEGYEYVIGSRKIKGGSNPTGWGFSRLFLSEVGGLVGRFILFFPFRPFFEVTDPTTGFKVTKVKGILDHLNLENSHLYSKSFGYKQQLLYETLALGAKYKEIPLVFQIRNAGESKIESHSAMDQLISDLKVRLYDPKMQKFLKFGIVGGFGFVINYLGLKFFNKTYSGLPLSIGIINFFANATASEISIVSNFIFNNLWTFSQQKITDISELFSKFITFNLSSVVGGILVPSLIIGLGTQFFGDQYRTLFLVIAVFGFTVPYNWFVYNKFIWSKVAVSSQQSK